MTTTQTTEGTFRVEIETRGIARPRVIVRNASGEQAYRDAMAIRRRVQSGERLYITDDTTFMVIEDRCR